MADTGPVAVGVFVFDGVKMLDFAGPAEVFAEANMFGGDYELTYVSPDGGDVSTSINTRVVADVAPADAPPFDVVIIPGSELPPPVFVTDAVADGARQLVGRSRRIAAICSGAFVLAEIGALEGRRAVTHWKFVDALRDRYPGIDVEPDAIFVKDGNVYSSAGVAAGIDLGLAIVEEDHGADVARSVAQGLLVYMQRAGGQSQFSAPLSLPSPTTPLVRAVVEVVQADPTGDHSVQNLAARVSISPRHLTRRFREEVDSTPSEFVATLRLDIAKAMLDRGFSVARTAAEAGYPSAESLRRSFVARLGISPLRYQRRFMSTRREA